MSLFSSLYPRSLQIQTKEGKQNKQSNVQQPERILHFTCPLLFFLCVSIHILRWYKKLTKCCVFMCNSSWIAVCYSVVWQCRSSETAAFWLLCDITCCCHCNNLILPSKCAALHVVPDWWDWACEGRAARLYGDPGPSVSQGCSGDGRLSECLWLQSRVACHGGGGASMHLPLHLLAVMNVKLIKTH